VILTKYSASFALLASTIVVARALASVPAIAPPPPPVRKTHAQMAADTVDRYVLPHVDALARAAARLETAMDALCADGAAPDAARTEARAAFADTVKAWAGVDFIRFGPGMQKNRIERVFFWPDPRTFTSRQLAQALAARAPGPLEPAGIERQSVAVQGLTALEILLFDDKAPLATGTDEAAKYRCGFARAIAANLGSIAGDLASGWAGDAGYRAKMLNTGPDNPLYKDSSETAREVVKALVTGLDLAGNRFAIPELTAISQDPPKKARLPFERSGLSGAFFQSSLGALHELFDTIGLAAYIPAEKPWMAKFFPRAWPSLTSDAGHLDDLRTEERGSEDHLQALRKMKFDLSGMRQIIIKELAPNAGIIMGFNELDGD